MEMATTRSRTEGPCLILVALLYRKAGSKARPGCVTARLRLRYREADPKQGQCVTAGVVVPRSRAQSKAQLRYRAVALSQRAMRYRRSCAAANPKIGIYKTALPNGNIVVSFFKMKNAVARRCPAERKLFAVLFFCNKFLGRI